MKGIHRGLKAITDPIEPNETDKPNELPDTNNFSGDVESELEVGDGFDVNKDMSFGWPRADETIDLDFVIHPKMYMFSIEVESSDEEDNLNTEFEKAFEDELEFERKADSPDPGINPSKTKYQIETENVGIFSF